MQLEYIYYLSQIFAAVAVVGSLIFVGVQIRQSDKTQRALMHQARAQRTMDFTLGIVEPHNTELMGKLYDGDCQLSPGQLSQLLGIIRAYVLNFEDICWQHKAGLLDATAFENTRAGLRRFFSLCGVRAAWNISRDGYAPDLTQLVEDHVLRDLPVAAPTSRLDKWRAEVDRLKTVV